MKRRLEALDHALTKRDTSFVRHLLLQAVNNGDYEYIETLLMAGYEVNVEDNRGNTALHYSASMGDAEVCALLIKYHANIFAKNIHGQLPLHLAVLSGSLEAVQYMADMNSNPYEEDKDGMTPYGLACLHGNLDIVKYFVEESGMSPNMVFAAKGNQDRVVEYLLERGGRPCEQCLQYAIKHNNTYMFREFVKHYDNISAVTYQGVSMLQVMHYYNATNIFPLYESKVKSDSYMSKITENLDKIVLSNK